jgi:hypothetical protein
LLPSASFLQSPLLDCFPHRHRPPYLSPPRAFSSASSFSHPAEHGGGCGRGIGGEAVAVVGACGNRGRSALDVGLDVIVAGGGGQSHGEVD